MHHLNPSLALALLVELGVITRPEADEFRRLGGSHRRLVSEHLVAELRERLAPAGVEVAHVLESHEARERALLAEPRYANAPQVSGVFVGQMWSEGNYLIELWRKPFVVPLAFLVEHRSRLVGVRDYGDSDWIVEELGLSEGHAGPFDVDEIEESIRRWLDSTRTPTETCPQGVGVLP